MESGVFGAVANGSSGAILSKARTKIERTTNTTEGGLDR